MLHLILAIGGAIEAKPDLAMILETEFGGCGKHAMIAGAWTYQRNHRMKDIKPPNKQAQVVAETYQDYPDPGYYFAFSDNDLTKQSVKQLITDTGAIKGMRFNCVPNGGVNFYRLPDE